MNFIVGSLLYHSEEYITFWLIIELTENFQMRDNYKEGFPGLKKHCIKINKVFSKELGETWQNIQKSGIDFNFILVEWLFSLFCSIIPLELQIDFFINFFDAKWDYFYKVCQCIIRSKNLQSYGNDSDEIYMALRFNKSNEGNNKEKIEYWSNILEEASNI